MTESEMLEIDIMFIQVREIFKYIDKTLFEKTPLKIRNYITSYKGISNYSFKYDITKKLDEQQISNQTRNFIALMDYNYWASEEDKKTIEKAWELNEANSDAHSDAQVSTDISFQSFDQSDVNHHNESNNLVIKKESFFTKLLNYIKSIFKRRNKNEKI